MKNFRIGKTYILIIWFIITYISFTSITLAQPQISVTPAQVDFGVVSEIKTYWKTFYVHNNGSAVLYDTLSFNVGYQELSVFPLIDSVVAGDSSQIVVAFNPTEMKIYLDTIRIKSNDPVTPELLVTVLVNYTRPKISLNKEYKDFGEIVLGDSSIFTLGIYNLGILPLIVSDISSTNPYFYADYTSIIVDSMSLENTEIKFKPLEEGYYYDTLIVHNNDPDDSTKLFIVSGTGIWPHVELTNNVINFNEVEVSSIGGVNLPIYNSGSADILIENITGITGSDTLYFSLSDTSESISPGDSSSILVTFSPDSEITYSDVLSIKLSRPDTTLTIYLQGEGTKPELTFIPAALGDSIAFGNVCISKDSTINLTIGNSGTIGNLKIWNIHYDSTNIFNIDTTSRNIVPGGSIVLPITFNPAVRMQYSDSINFFTNDTGKTYVSIPLKGTGSAPIVAFNPSDSCKFDSTPVGSTSTCTLYVSNSGNGVLSITDIFYQVGMESIFDINISSGMTVGQGSVDTFLIDFTPDEGRIFADTFVVRTDDPDNESTTFWLYGVGKASEISVNVQNHDFGDTLTTGDSTSWNLMVLNSGTDILRIDSIVTTNRSMLLDKVFKVDNYNNTLISADDSLSVEIRYVPKENRRYIDTLKVYSNANKEPIFPVVLSSNSTKNYFPVITSVPDSLVLGTVNVNEDTIYNYCITAEDLDIEPLHLTIQNPTAGLSVDTLGYTGGKMSWEMNWTPDQVHVGMNQVFIIVEDINAVSDTQMYNVAVSNVNDAPSIVPIPDAIAYVDSLFSLQVEATDQENDSISYLLLSTPTSSYGKMTISNTGLIQWKPDINFKDSYVEVVFRVSDIYGKNTYVSFKINVLTFNYLPEIVNKISEILIPEDFGSLIVADLDTIFSDRDSGTVLEYSAVSDTSEVEVNLTSENNVSIITQENYFGNSALILSASDEENTIYDTVSVSVLPINDPPVISYIADTVISEGSLFIYQVQVEDVDSENFNYELLFYPYGMTVDSLGLIEWLSDNNDVGDTVATVVVYDDSLASDSLTFNITVVNIINNPPVISGIPDIITVEDFSDSSINLYNYVSDSDNDTIDLRFEASGHSNMDVSIDKNLVKIIPHNNWSGKDSVIFTAFDPSDAYSTDTISVQVTAVNDPPVIVFIPDTVISEDSLFIYQIQVEDVDSENFSYELLFYPYGMTVDSSGLIEWIPDNDDVGDTIATVVVSDDSLASDSLTFTITVVNINNPPVLSGIPDITIVEDFSDSSINLYDYVSDSDNDENELNFYVSVATNISAAIDIDNVKITPNIDWAGIDTLVFKASDPSNAFSMDTVVITVISVNDPPMIKNLENLVFNEEDTLILSLNQFAHDIDDSFETLKWEIYGGENISFSIQDTSAVFWAISDWNGSEDLKFILTDSSGFKDSTVTKISVLNINDPPVLAYKVLTYNIKEEDSLKVGYADWANDLDDSELSWDFKEDEKIKISEDEINKEIWFKPVKDFFGSDTLKMSVFDSSGGTDSGLVIINVENINDPPVIVSVNPDEDSVFIERGKYVDFTFSGDDVDGDILNVIWNLNGSIVSAEKTYRYTAGSIMEVKSLKLIISDGKKSVFRDWVIMSGWEVSIVIESFYALDLKKGGIEIRWNILDGEGNLGFNILRSKNESGNYEKINDELIYDNGENEFAFFDNNINSGERYYYKLEYIDILGNKLQHGPISIVTSIPDEWNLFQNYPNPFNYETVINFSIPEHSSVNISIYSVNGKLICTLIDTEFKPGFYTVIWDGKNSSGYFVSSGVYFCILKNEKNIFIRKIIFFK